MMLGQVNIRNKRMKLARNMSLEDDLGHALEKPPESSVRKLGGEATSLELIDFIGNDVEMQETYGHRLETILGSAKDHF